MRAKSSSTGAVGGRWYTPWLFLVPGLTLFGVFFVWPAATAIQLAFYKYDVVTAPVFVGMRNFAHLLEDDRFWSAVRNSLILLVGLLPMSVVIPLLLAVLVNQKLRFIQVYRLIYYLPVVTSMVAVAVAWNYVFHHQGVINWMLTGFGILDEPVQYLLDPNWALAALTVVEGWKGMGTYMMIYLAGLQAIPGDLYEAARMDGANAWQRLRSVTIPLIVPYFAVALTIEMMDAMQVFTSVYVMTKGGPQDHTLTLGYYIWSAAFEQYDMGYASAMGLVLWALLIAFALLNYRLTKGRTV
ncbi:MAG TPA: sugar ABC transporter permease [Candidatus Limnocylindrales bacterium]